MNRNMCMTTSSPNEFELELSNGILRKEKSFKVTNSFVGIEICYAQKLFSPKAYNRMRFCKRLPPLIHLTFHFQLNHFGEFKCAFLP